jgi:tetratricopeptide (TPR) repeat protein
MKAGACLAVALFALLVTLQGEPAAAQADAHALALARAACQSGRQSEPVTEAAAALEREPNELGPRMRLADALVDQGCYQEAVAVLEAGQQAYPRNKELSGKLRDVRSLVTEQTYIEGLTQAAEGAKLQRNQLRCTRLADVTACDDALKSKPDDEQLLLAKGDALMQGNRPTDAVIAYRHASQLKPGDDAIKTKLAAAEALVASTTQPAPAASQVAAADTAARPKPPKRAPAVGTAANADSAAGAAAGTVANAGSAAGTAAGSVADAGSAAGTTAAGTVANAGSATGTAAGSVANARSAAGTVAGTAAGAGAAARARQASAKNAGPESAASLAAARTPVGAQAIGGQHLTTTPLATVAALDPQEARTYSNDAPPGRTN